MPGTGSVDVGLLAIRARRGQVPPLPLVWALAWLPAFELVYLTVPRAGRPGPWDLPEWAAWLLFVLLLGAAVLGQAGHVAGRVSTTRGLTRQLAVVLGWAWLGAFAGCLLLVAVLALAGVSGPGLEQVAVTVPALLVAALFLAGGLLWGDRTQFLLGVWLAVTAQAGAVLGVPDGAALVALLGAVGFAAVAVGPALVRKD